MQETAPAQEAEFDTDDETDEAAQYEAWRERELKRIARDRCSPCAHRIAVFSSASHISDASSPLPLQEPTLRNNTCFPCRQLRQAGTKAEAAAAATPSILPPPVQPKKKWKFLQVRVTFGTLLQRHLWS